MTHFFPGAGVFNLADSVWSVVTKRPLITLIIKAKSNCVAYFGAQELTSLNDWWNVLNLLIIACHNDAADPSNGMRLARVFLVTDFAQLITILVTVHRFRIHPFRVTFHSFSFSNIMHGWNPAFFLTVSFKRLLESYEGLDIITFRISLNVVGWRNIFKIQL